MTTDSSGTTAVDQEYHWRPVTTETPRGVKLQLINVRDGTAYYGLFTGGRAATHWAPLPTFAKQ